MLGVQSALTIAELKEMARRRVPKMFFEYVDTGAFEGSTYRNNAADYEEILLVQRVARSLSNRNLKSTLAGTEASMPVALAPIGMCGMVHPDGEMLAARAAEKFGVPFTLSTVSVCSIEDVRSVTTKPFWFQLYVMQDKDFMKRLLDRAKAAGVSTLVLTMDLQLLAKRHNDVRNGLSNPPKFTPKHMLQVMSRPGWALKMLGTKRRGFGNIMGHVKGVDDLRSLSSWTAGQFDPELSWKSAEYLRDHWDGKLIVKGVMHPDDALDAARFGADAVVVSNHGGRQLDSSASALRVFSEIKAAVGDRTELHMDGGIDSGTDILKALALGAKAAWVGRSFVWGLGAGGEAGVTHALNLLRDELDINMALCGEKDIANVGPHLIYRNGLLG